jgi:glutamate 5-kinase
MMTKMKTAKSVAKNGIEVRIANGTRQNILLDVVLNPETAVCTRFLTPKNRKK